MTREKFIKVLDEYFKYPYEIEGDKIVVTHDALVYLSSLKTLPPEVKFNNGGDVYLSSLKTLPSGVVFNNVENVYLSSLETLPSGAEFRNGKDIYLEYIKRISPGVEFNNEGDVYLESLLNSIPPSSRFGGRGGFHNWSGNIEGIEPNKLLNKMIADGVFDRR